MLASFSFVVFFVAFLQGSAFLARQYLESVGVCNSEGPFGVSTSSLVLSLVGVGSVLFFIHLWWKEAVWQRTCVWLLLFSAGLSNMLERVLSGCIFDFLSLPFIPLFNVADVILTLGVVFLIWWELFRGKKE